MGKKGFTQNKLIRFVTGKGFYLALAIALVGAGAATWMVVDKTLNTVPDISGAPMVSEIVGEPITQQTPQVQADKPQSNVPVQSKPQPSSQKSSASSSASSVQQDKSEASVEAQNPFRQQFMLPVAGEIIQQFSNGELVKSVTMNDWRTHDGVDIQAAAGTAVKAAGDGTVMQVYDDPLWGKCVHIEHTNGLISCYYSLDENTAVKQGDRVAMGQTIGTVSSSASCEISLPSHLHFAIKERKEWIDPLKLANQP